MHDSWTMKLKKLPGTLVSRLRIQWLRFRGAKIGAHCWIQAIEMPANRGAVLIEDHVSLDRQVSLLTAEADRGQPRIILRRGVYINRFTVIDAAGRIEIGENSMIGPFCYITDHDHGCAPGSNIKSQELCVEPVTIGEDVWIGAGVVLLKGVTIGDGAVVGAGAVVTRDIPPGVKVAGVPAREFALR